MIQLLQPNSIELALSRAARPSGSFNLHREAAFSSLIAYSLNR